MSLGLRTETMEASELVDAVPTETPIEGQVDTDQTNSFIVNYKALALIEDKNDIIRHATGQDPVRDGDTKKSDEPVAQSLIAEEKVEVPVTIAEGENANTQLICLTTTREAFIELLAKEAVS
jgi:hypothetical protein